MALAHGGRALVRDGRALARDGMALAHGMALHEPVLAHMNMAGKDHQEHRNQRSLSLLGMARIQLASRMDRVASYRCFVVADKDHGASHKFASIQGIRHSV